jgi:hypothetical protein
MASPPAATQLSRALSAVFFKMAKAMSISSCVQALIFLLAFTREEEDG